MLRRCALSQPRRVLNILFGSCKRHAFVRFVIASMAAFVPSCYFNTTNKGGASLVPYLVMASVRLSTYPLRSTLFH
jgi:hypothetical protein